MSTLIFFDINGTLIERDARTDLPIEEAMNTLLDTQDALKGVDTAARSDKDVFKEVLGKFNRPYTEALFETLCTLYRTQLEAYKDSDVWRANVDAVPFVKALATKDVDLALITGELSLGAQYKLEKIGVYAHFPVGGFGEDGLKRFEIAESALKKAEAHYGKTYDRLYVIGDTVLDIQTARHIGAKAIAIATGAHTAEALTAENPDKVIHTFAELADYEVFAE